MKQLGSTLITIVGAAACLAAVELTEDKPVTRPPKRGSITGTIASAQAVTSIKAVSRTFRKDYKPSSFDAKTGRFEFRDLPGEASYDICVRMGSRTVEGIDLSFVDARMLRLAALRRKQLRLPPEREHEFTTDDVQELLTWIRSFDDFMEIRRVLYVQGHGARATVLVELMRTRQFHASKGQIIWRVELWYFRERFGGWERTSKQEHVLHRKRTSPAAWRKIHLEYYPELSVYIDVDGESAPVNFTVPKPDITRGRLPNTAPDIKTEPHLLGLAAGRAPATQATTRPAK